MSIGTITRRNDVLPLDRVNDEIVKRTEFLAFKLGDESFAVRISCITEIMKALPITEVPRASAEVVGVMSVRGRLVTVVDLRPRFGLPARPAGRLTRILLVDVGLEEIVGLVVDEVREVVRLSETEIEPPSALGGEQPPHILGVGRPGGEVLVLLDLLPLLGV